MKILIADPVSQQGIEMLAAKHDVDVKTKLSETELVAIIPEYDAMVVRSETKVTKAILEAAAKLKVIGRAGVGVDNIDVGVATQKGIIVLNAPEGNTVAATEHTMAMMLALSRNVANAHASMQQGKWERGKFMGIEVRGKTLGILGLGRIGSGVAKRALAMEMNIIAYDPFISRNQAKSLGIELGEIDDVFRQADFITMHLPLTAETKNLINKDSIAKMKDGVRIINCARGGVINEYDLAEALAGGKVAGAAIDVFAKEPLDSSSPLLGLPNVVLTPHLGASTIEAQVGVAVDVAAGILSALAGEPVTTAVNMAHIPTHVLEIIKPYFNLAERMGCLAVHIAEGPMLSIDVEYNGEIADVDTKMLTTAVVKGALNPILQTDVNYVNANGLAKDRGIKVKEVKSIATANFANLITVRLRSERSEHVVAGTLFGLEEARIVLIDGHRVDVDPQGWILTGEHADRPGIIGKVGTVLGEHGINIGGMQVGRTETAGTNIMTIVVDNEVPASVMLKIKALDGIVDLKLVNFTAK